jgi:hypothetical protein
MLGLPCVSNCYHTKVDGVYSVLLKMVSIDEKILSINIFLVDCMCNM